MTPSTHRILIFDDDILSCKLLQKVLMKEGYQAEYVTNYENFTLKMSKEWDLLMLDLNIPDRDGFSILNELKKK
jgi:DNA-binding response OmpR family regulator